MYERPHEVVCVSVRSGASHTLVVCFLLPQVPVKEGKAETKEDRQKVAHLFAKSPSVESLEARIKTWKVKLRKLVLTMKNKVTTVVGGEGTWYTGRLALKPCCIVATG